MKREHLVKGEFYYYKFGVREKVVLQWGGIDEAQHSYDLTNKHYEGITRYLGCNDHIIELRKATAEEKRLLTACMEGRGIKISEPSVDNYVIY